MSRKLLQIATFYYIKSFHRPHLKKGNHAETRPSSFFVPCDVNHFTWRG